MQAMPNNLIMRVMVFHPLMKFLPLSPAKAEIEAKKVKGSFKKTGFHGFQWFSIRVIREIRGVLAVVHAP